MQHKKAQEAMEHLRQAINVLRYQVMMTDLEGQAYDSLLEAFKHARAARNALEDLQ